MSVNRTGGSALVTLRLRWPTYVVPSSGAPSHSECALAGALIYATIFFVSIASDAA